MKYTAYVQPNVEGKRAKPGPTTQSLVFPFNTDAGIPVVFIPELGDEIVAGAIPAPPGLIGVRYFDRERRLYVVDINGEAWQNGYMLPGRQQPQALDIDENHPFFAKGDLTQVHEEPEEAKS